MKYFQNLACAMTTEISTGPITSSTYSTKARVLTSSTATNRFTIARKIFTTSRNIAGSVSEKSATTIETFTPMSTTSTTATAILTTANAAFTGD